MSADDEQKLRQLESLKQQLEQVKTFEPRVRERKQVGDGAKAAIDFGSAVAVGTILGYGFDQWQHTLPWGMLTGLLVGTSAGVKLMFQVEKNRQAREAKQNDKQD